MYFFEIQDVFGLQTAALMKRRQNGGRAARWAVSRMDRIRVEDETREGRGRWAGHDGLGWSGVLESEPTGRGKPKKMFVKFVRAR